MGDEVAGIFAKVDFKIDKKGLNDLEKSISKIIGLFSSVNSSIKDFERNIKSMSSAASKGARKISDHIQKSASGSAVLSILHPYVDPLSKRRPIASGFASRLYGIPRLTGGTGGGDIIDIDGIPVDDSGRAEEKKEQKRSFKNVAIMSAAVGAFAIAVKKFVKFGQEQAKMFNRAQISATLLGLQTGQVIGATGAFNVTGGNVATFLNVAQRAQQFQAGMALGEVDQRRMEVLFRGRVTGNILDLLQKPEELTAAINEALERNIEVGDVWGAALLRTEEPSAVSMGVTSKQIEAARGQTFEQFSAFLDNLRGTAAEQKAGAVAWTALTAEFEVFGATMKGIFNAISLRWEGSVFQKMYDITFVAPMTAISKVAEIPTAVVSGIPAITKRSLERMEDLPYIPGVNPLMQVIIENFYGGEENLTQRLLDAANEDLQNPGAQ